MVRCDRLGRRLRRAGQHGSVARLAPLKASGQGRLVVAHANHQLRGAESDEDERFVRAQCEPLGLPCEIGRVPIVEFAEDSRRRHRGRGPCSPIRIFDRNGPSASERDSSPQGTRPTTRPKRSCTASCAGPASPVWPAAREPVRSAPATTLIRPLLAIRRGEVLAYLDRIGQPFRQDRSNSDPRFTRNRIRHELLPHLAQQYNPNVVEALIAAGRGRRESQQAIEPIIDALYPTAVGR